MLKYSCECCKNATVSAAFFAPQNTPFIMEWNKSCGVHAAHLLHTKSAFSSAFQGLPTRTISFCPVMEIESIPPPPPTSLPPSPSCFLSDCFQLIGAGVEGGVLVCTQV